MNSQNRYKQRSTSPPPYTKQFKEPPPPDTNRSWYQKQQIQQAQSHKSRGSVSQERRGRSREQNMRAINLYQEIKKNQKPRFKNPENENDRRQQIQRLRENYLERETRTSFFKNLLFFILIAITIGFLVFLLYNFYLAWKDPIYCSTRQKNDPNASTLVNFIKGQRECTACPLDGNCESGKLVCKCPFIERYGKCVEDPSEQTQIQAFVENLLDTLRNSAGEKICESDPGIKDSFSSSQIIDLFHKDLGDRCNINSMVQRLQDTIYSRQEEFQVEKENNLTIYRAKYPELSYECVANLFLRDNIFAIIIGSFTLLYLLFKCRVCYLRCKWKSRAKTIFQELKNQLEKGRVEEEEVHAQCGDEEGIIAEFQKILSRDRSVSRFQKIVGGKPTFFLQKKN